LRSPIETHGEAMATTADFTVSQGQRLPFVLSYGRSHRPVPPEFDAEQSLETTESFWRDWSSRCQYRGRWREAVMRSLLTLKALTFRDTGGIVAAPTTSLPEQLGGNRNWDYRFCWLRDATLTLLALMQAGYYDEAHAWRDWLHRSVAGSPEQLQIMYGIAGERRLTEVRVPWLPGYAGSLPVRIGNAASDQLQLDVYGEVMNALHHARDAGLASIPSAWSLQRNLVEHLEKIWEQPDEGIWEVRGGRRHFTFSKVMAWVAFERAVRDAEKYGLDAPLERWRGLCDKIHDTICREGFSKKKNAFTQSFGDDELDASLLMMPIVGFLPPDDPRIKSTIAAIERELVFDGFVARYRTESNVDGLPPGEGAFLPCSFWLADNYAMQGRMREMSAFWPRNTTRVPSDWWGISHRLFRISRCSAPRSISAARPRSATARVRSLRRRSRRDVARGASYDGASENVSGLSARWPRSSWGRARPTRRWSRSGPSNGKNISSATISAATSTCPTGATSATTNSIRCAVGAMRRSPISRPSPRKMTRASARSTSSATRSPPPIPT